MARRLSGDAVHADNEGQGHIAVPEPNVVAEELAAAAGRYRLPVGLGPVVALPDAALSWRWAELAARGAGAGVAIEAAAHLPALLLAQAPDIVAALRDRALAPRREETPSSRVRLESTLHAWLRHRGAQAAVAAELGVHPQTVRYRMGRLRELFGVDLEDPEKRFALELALQG